MLTVRPAQATDYEAFARLFPLLEVPDPVPSRERFVQAMAPAMAIACDDGAPVGYVFWRFLARATHVVQIVVDGAAQRRGVGKRMMDEVAARARAAGHERWVLYVKPENAQAQRLYERCGMRVDGGSTSMRIAWADVARLPSVDGCEAFSPRPEDDRATEQAFGLEPGQLAARRVPGSGFVVVGARDAAGPVGVAAFDPSFPGANPFRLRRGEHARALFEAMRPHALAGAAFVRFSADDRGLVDVARAAGAEVALEVWRMSGAVPPA